jgi:hypothetical protein
MRTGHLAAFGAVLVGAGLLATANPAAAAPGLVVGAVEDDLRASTLVEAQTRMTLFRLAGFRALRITSFWTPGLSAPSEGELEVLENVAGAAHLNGVRLYVTVMHRDRVRPRSPTRLARSSRRMPRRSCARCR